MIRLLLGNVVAVRAAGPLRRDGSPLTGDAAAPFVLELDGPGIVSIAPLDFAHYREVALDLWGETGRLAIQQEGLTITRFPRRPNRGVSGAEEIASDEPQSVEIGAAAALPALYTNLAQALRRGEALLSPLEFALGTERVIDAVFASAIDGGRRVEIAA